MMVFHCLRDSGLTHMAVRGDSPIVIQWRGGHTDFKTTQGYLDRGRVEARRIGEPLPPLPPDLFTPAPSSPQRDRGGSAGVLPQGKTSETKALEALAILRPQRELKAQPGEGDLEGLTRGSAEGQGIGAVERARNSEPVAGSSSSFGTGGGAVDEVEAALAGALSAAAAAGRFDVVAQLARELEARRLGRAGNVVRIDAARRPGSNG
jgi:hypothetical protein